LLGTTIYNHFAPQNISCLWPWFPTRGARIPWGNKKSSNSEFKSFTKTRSNQWRNWRGARGRSSSPAS